MKIFIILYILSILHFCQCGNEKDQIRRERTQSTTSEDVFHDALTDQPNQVVEGSSAQEGENLARRSATELNKEDGATGYESNDVFISQFPPRVTSPLRLSPLPTRSRSNSLESATLDISHPLSSIFYCIDVDVDGIPAEVFLTAPGVTVTQVVDGSNKIAAIERSSKCIACVTFQKSNEPKIAVVVTRHSGCLAQKYYKNVKTSGCLNLRKVGWHKLKNPGQKINKLRIGSSQPTKFPMDISDTFDSTNYRMIVHETGSITARYYATKPGHIMGKILDQGHDIFHFTEGAICYLCEIHTRNDHSLMRLHIRKDYFFYFCFERRGNEKWVGLAGRVFDEALRMMYEDIRFKTYNKDTTKTPYLDDVCDEGDIMRNPRYLGEYRYKYWFHPFYGSPITTNEIKNAIKEHNLAYPNEQINYEEECRFDIVYCHSNGTIVDLREDSNPDPDEASMGHDSNRASFTLDKRGRMDADGNFTGKGEYSESNYLSIISDPMTDPTDPIEPRFIIRAKPGFIKENELKVGQIFQGVNEEARELYHDNIFFQPRSTREEIYLPDGTSHW